MALSLLADAKVPLSKEENDILHRNAKKIKNDEGKIHDEEWPKLGTEGSNQKAPGTSFVEKLKGINQVEKMVEDPVNDSDDSLSKDDDHEPVGGRANGSSMEQTMGSGQEVETAEEWKVVQRPRRQKKTGKDAKHDDVRRKEKGSRFGVLADEGSVGVDEQIVTNQVAVRDVVVEANLPRNPTSAQQGREKKAESKKKLRKEHLQREQAKGEFQREGVVLQGMEKGEEAQRSNEGPTVECVNDPILGPDLGHFAEGVLEVGETDASIGPIGEGGPVGKFWATPLSIESDLDLVLEEPSGDSMMDKSIFYWNVRGACGPSLLQNIKLACFRYSPSLVVLSETKCERIDKLQCVSKLSFDGTACVPSVGRSGGLFAAWKSDKINVEVLHQGRQLFHFRCRFPGVDFFFVTAVYAIQDSQHKQLLWSELRNFALSMVDPWTVIGDFNDIAFSTKRTGGMGSQSARCTLFSDRMRDCNLIDLGAVGPIFTWKGPKLRGMRRLFERLDRVIANQEFISAFTESLVQGS
ncbi:hypothetical protein K1719_027139 [Acacia pycnantha]|nr:hypothetical protein K1719_027139 [Acacia pycnantha]